MRNFKADFENCSLLTRSLLRKEANKDWVEFSHDGDCSFAGVYQPPLAKIHSKDDEFILTSNYHDVWQFLQLPRRALVQDVKNGAKRICEMDLHALKIHNSLLVDSPVKSHDDLLQYCFRATLTFEMLYTGYGFPLEYEITSADVVNGQKLGWALGSTLYEINTLPWEFGGGYEAIPQPHHRKKHKKHKHKKHHKKSPLLAWLGMANSEEDTFTQETETTLLLSGGYRDEQDLFSGFLFVLAMVAIVSVLAAAVLGRRRWPRPAYQPIPEGTI